MIEDPPSTPVESITNDQGGSAIFAPLAVSLTELFSKIEHAHELEIQGHQFKDRAPFEMEDDKVIDQHVKRGAKIINLCAPAARD